jgi:hypothetical protein
MAKNMALEKCLIFISFICENTNANILPVVGLICRHNCDFMQKMAGSSSQDIFIKKSIQFDGSALIPLRPQSVINLCGLRTVTPKNTKL